MSNYRDTPTDERSLICLDWDDNVPLLLYGDENDKSINNAREIEVILAPCNYLPSESSAVSEQCITDPEEQF